MDLRLHSWVFCCDLVNDRARPESPRARSCAGGVPPRATSTGRWRRCARRSPVPYSGVSGGATLGLAMLATGVPMAGAVRHEPAVGSCTSGWRHARERRRPGDDDHMIGTRPAFESSLWTLETGQRSRWCGGTSARSRARSASSSLSGGGSSPQPISRSSSGSSSHRATCDPMPIPRSHLGFPLGLADADGRRSSALVDARRVGTPILAPD